MEAMEFKVGFVVSGGVRRLLLSVGLGDVASMFLLAISISMGLLLRLLLLDVVEAMVDRFLCSTQGGFLVAKVRVGVAAWAVRFVIVSYIVVFYVVLALVTYATGRVALV